MADETGFLDSIGVGAQDERALFEEQRRQESIKSSAGQSQAQFGRGENIGAGLFGALRNLIKPANGGTRGVKDTINAGAAASQNIEDRQAAQAAGITVDKLKGRRKFREAISKSSIPQDGAFDNRIKMAEFAAKTANDLGLTDATAASLGQVTALRKEKAEFAKLGSQNKKLAADAIEAGIRDVYVGASTTPTAGILSEQNGIPGVIVDGKFMSSGYSLEGPDVARETLDQRYRKVVPAGDRTQIGKMIDTGASSVRQYRRVLSTIIDLSQEGGVNSVLSTSGNVISWVDNAARNVQGILDPILGKNTFNKDTGKTENSAQHKTSFRQRASDAASDFWIGEDGNSILPQEFQDASSAAQQHRAMIMELAYLAARMAEPSNRGLSDNDIKNAMRRIAGGTSNPQVMMRRFAEMTFDGAAGIETTIGRMHGMFRDVPRGEFEDFIGGDTLTKYRKDLASLQSDFGFSINQDGRASFTGAPLDSDVAPGEGVPGLQKAPGAVQDAQSDAEFLDTF